VPREGRARRPRPYGVWLEGAGTAPLLVCSFLLALFLGLPGEHAQPTFTLALVGDVMLGRGVAQALDGEWGAAFAEVQPWLVGADLAFANLESPLTTAPQVKDGYDLRAPPEAVAALQAAGFDVVSVINNHTFDAGRAGAWETLNTLRAADIAPVVDWETGRLVGWEIGRLVDGGQFPMYQSISIPTYQVLAFDDSAGPMDVEVAVRAVAAAAERADVLIVSVHWGGEYQAAPSPRQRTIAAKLAAAGADLIVGHGPHVLQRATWVKGTPVAYSLGNFLFDQPYPADCRWGAILRVTLRGDRIVAVEALPTTVERGRVRPADPKTGAAILARLNLEP